MVEYQLRLPVCGNTAFVPTTRGGAREILHLAGITRAERARGVRRYFTPAGMVAVWAPQTEAHKRLKPFPDASGGTIYRRVWGG
jgi:hypothetical protein